MISQITACIVIALLTLRWLRSTEPAPLGIPTSESQCAIHLNTIIHKVPLVPVWIRVYAIGVVDTITTVLWRRGLLGTSSSADELIEKYGKQKDKVCIITGGDSGIGLEVVRGLLQAGLKVIIASRTSELAAEAKAQLGEDVTYMTVDLMSFKSVQRFVESVKSTVPKGGIDVLINNAGIMNTPCHMTEDGLEGQFQTNCLSPLYLSLLLLPWMRQNGRILFAASSTLYAPSNLDMSLARQGYGWDGLTHYAHSKLCVATLSQCLGSQLRDIQVFCYHPGAVRTKLFSHTMIFTLPIFSWLFDFIMLTPSEGSITPLYLCLAPQLSSESGSYWSSTVHQPVPECGNVEKVWKAALDLCGLTSLEAEALIRQTCHA
ncbi:hypothetical protein BJV82DRAFT_130599 [Fennellomyces sp. T-0311]|nr:hypothetical protein BJV82DRAFT_130599 [Fennellomyces sp. T-0311]